MGMALKKPAAEICATLYWLSLTVETLETSCLPTSYPQKETATVVD
jgi:hypothetical protein